MYQLKIFATAQNTFIGFIVTLYIYKFKLRFQFSLITGGKCLTFTIAIKDNFVTFFLKLNSHKYCIKKSLVCLQQINLTYKYLRSNQATLDQTERVTFFTSNA